jgi:hypothetical protein
MNALAQNVIEMWGGIPDAWKAVIIVTIGASLIASSLLTDFGGGRKWREPGQR